MNEHDDVIGFATNPETDHTTAWLQHCGGQPVALGLSGPGYMAPDGTHYSMPAALNECGEVVGVSERYLPGVPAGRTPWYRTHWHSTRVLGFQTGIHRSASGMTDGEATHLTDSGYVAGYSIRYAPGTDTPQGQTAWVTHRDHPNIRSVITRDCISRAVAGPGQPNPIGGPVRLDHPGRGALRPVVSVRE